MDRNQLAATIYAQMLAVRGSDHADDLARESFDLADIWGAECFAREEEKARADAEHNLKRLSLDKSSKPKKKG